MKNKIKVKNRIKIKIKVKIKSRIPPTPFEKGGEKQIKDKNRIRIKVKVKSPGYRLMGRYDSSVVEGLVSRHPLINQQLNAEQDLFYFFLKKK